MLCGYLPFEDPDTAILYRKILKGDFEIPEFLSKKAEKFLQGLLCTDPRQRLTLEQIRKHPWFAYYNERANQSIDLDGQKRLGVSADEQIARKANLKLEEDKPKTQPKAD